MTLLVISHTAHAWIDNRYYGWGPTVAEVNFLATKFDQVVHIATVRGESDIPQSYLPVNSNIRIVPIRNRGGPSLISKMRVLWDSAAYWLTIWRELRSQVDLIHVRCPANISLVALILLVFFPAKRKWIKYAGDWRPRRDFLSYRIQRYIIKNFLAGHIATINGCYPNEKKFIHHILNPSFGEEEVLHASYLSESKVLGDGDFKLLFVGSLEKNKGIDIALEAFRLLSLGYHGKFDIIGDGSELENLRKTVDYLGLKSNVRFLGLRSREEIKSFYATAHFIILPSQGEGWPKVISEGMSYGVIPIVSNVSSIKSILHEVGIGKVVSEYSGRSYADAISDYLLNTDDWKVQSRKAMSFAIEFSFEKWWVKLSSYLFKENTR